MRTSNMRVSALLLAFLTAVAGGGTLSAAQPDAGSVARQADGETVYTGNHTIDAGETVDDIVVVGGDLRVHGEVTGNAVVVGGNLFVEETAIIAGDAVVTGGELIVQGGQVRGEMRTLGGPGIDIAREIQRAIEGGAAGTREGTTESARSETRVIERSSSDSHFLPWSVRRGFAGIVSTLALALVIGGIGAGLVFYGRPYLETVSDTVRSSTVRAGATGLAASFLAIPAFVVLVVALVVSIVGIPFLLLAVPLYPVALFAAAVYGLLAVLHAIGERTAEQSRDRLDLRYRNSYAYLLTGLGMLFLPMIAAYMISMTGFLSFIGVLLMVVTCLAIWVATTVGFGAVILSRGGTRRTFAAPSPAADPAFSTDDFIDDELGISGHA